jgi:hypothetical protein
VEFPGSGTRRVKIAEFQASRNLGSAGFTACKLLNAEKVLFLYTAYLYCSFSLVDIREKSPVVFP